MAISEGFFGDQSGNGRGLDYILPQTRSQDYAFQLAQDQSKRLATQAAAKLKRQQTIQDSIGREFASQQLPQFWAPFNSAINDKSEAWQKKAAEYNATTGKSPFQNPELMSEYNRDVKGLGVQSKQLGDNYSKLYSAAVADGGNKYTPESIKEVMDFQEKVSLDPIAALNKPLPQLKTQPADFSAFTKELKPVAIKNETGNSITTQANRADHIDQAAGIALNNPEKWGPLLMTQFGVDVTKPTFPLLGSTGRNVYPTNDTAVETIATKILSGPNAQEQLVEIGIDPTDKFAPEKLSSFIKQQNDGFGKFLTQSADYADARVGKSNAVSYKDEDQAMKRERLALSRASGERAERSANKSTGSDQETYRQQWVDDMWSGKEGSGEKLKSIVGAKAGYDKDLGIIVKGDKITFNIPSKTSVTINDEGEEKSKTIPGRTVTVDKNKPEDKQKLNTLISDLTGENINPTKFNTVGGKGKEQRTQTAPSSAPKSITRSELSKRAAASGYSASEYEKLLKQRGIKIQ